MSKRLRQLQLRLHRQDDLANDEERLAWLNSVSFEGDGHIGPEEWSDTMNALAHRLARDRGIGPVEAWLYVARTLAASVPDPEDKLYGMTLAVHARNAGLRCEDARTVAELFGLYVAQRDAWEEDETDDPDEIAYQTYEFIVNRLEEVRTAVENPLENEEAVTQDMLADPAVVVAGSELLWDVIEDQGDRAEAEGGELDDAMLAQYSDYVGHYLWAAYHAKRRGIDADELRSFVIAFGEWFEVMDALVRRNDLAPGVLASLRDCVNAGASRIVEEGPDLVGTWRRHHSEDLSLTDYLTNCLTAVVQDA